MEYMRADQLSFDSRRQLSRIFVEGFYLWIKQVCKDKEKLIEVFTHAFILKNFYIAAETETVTAMAACTQGIAPIELNRRVFTSVLGVLRGNIVYFILKRHMIRSSYPFTLSPKTGSIEFVATAPEFRQRGIARELLTFIMKNCLYDSYVLEVADTNANAVYLYESLGFKEIRREKAPRRSGVNFFLYMRKEMSEHV